MVRTLLCHWLRRLLPAGRRPTQPPAQVRPAFRPRLEILEDRLTPSVTFAGQQTFAVGANPSAVAVADFNGDGRPDLVVVNQGANTISVLLNTTPAGATTETFAAAQTFAVGAGPDAVAVGDFNGDGRPDIVVANATSGTVSVLWNTTLSGASAPAFAPQQTFAVGANPSAVAVADFNGDGRPDIVVANNNAVGAVTVLLDTTANGALTLSFAAPQTFAVGSHPLSVAVGDFNGDGRADIVAANSGDGTASVLLDTTTAGAAAPAFAAAQSFAVGGDPVSVAVGDFNGDGRPDIAVANNAVAGTMTVLLDTTTVGAGTASFATPQTFAVGNGPHALAVGDFSGDGRPDLIVVNTTDKTASLLVNTTAAGAGTPSFAPQQTFNVGTGVAAVAAADFNGDDRPDFVVVNAGDSQVGVLLDTTAPFTVTTPVIVADFPGGGLWELNRVSETYVQINVSDVSLLAADPQGDVVADFPHYGVWEYHPATGGWTQLNTSDIGALAMDRYGDVVADFPHYGVAEYRPSVGWRMLGSGDATLLAMDGNGDVYGEYPGQGVWELRPASGWAQVAPGDATVLAVNASGVLVGSFAGYGIAEYQPTTGWQLLNSNTALALAIDAYGDVTASITGLGIAEHRPSYGWRGLAPTSPTELAMDGNGDVFAEIPGYGLWEYDPFPGWYRLSGTDASLLAVA